MAIEIPSAHIKGKGSTEWEFWRDEIIAGVRYRDIYGKAKKWQVYKNMYRGFWGTSTGDKKIVPVNLMYAIGRSLVPQVYLRNPRVAVNPSRPGFAMHARVLERIDNYLIRETGLKNELKSLVLDNFLCGTGPIIIGYDTEYGFNPAQLSEDFSDSTLTGFSKTGDKIEYSDKVKPGMPWALRCNPSDFIVPWGTKHWQEARWFAFRKMRLLRDIKADPKYKNKGDLKGEFTTKLDGSSQGTTNADPSYLAGNTNDWVEIFQIHDKRSGKVRVISLSHPKFLRDDIDFLQIEGLPAEVLQFNEDPDYFWAAPDARMIEVQQTELNDIRTVARAHRRAALLKMLIDGDVFKEEDVDALLNGDPKAVVRLKLGANADIRKVVHLLQSHVPPDLHIAATEVREDTREVTGFSRNQMGAFEAPGGRRTAHEAEIVRAASAIRIDERRDMMVDLLERVVRKENQLIFKYWGEERVVDVVGDDGARYWVRFTGKELKGEFHYKINPEESIPEDRRTRKAEALELMQIAKEIPGANMKYLLEQYAGQMDWLDPKMMFPSNEPGRSPEKAMLFSQFAGRNQGGGSFPALGAQ